MRLLWCLNQNKLQPTWTKAVGRKHQPMAKPLEAMPEGREVRKQAVVPQVGWPNPSTAVMWDLLLGEDSCVDAMREEKEVWGAISWAFVSKLNPEEDKERAVNATEKPAVEMHLNNHLQTWDSLHYWPIPSALQIQHWRGITLFLFTKRKEELVLFHTFLPLSTLKSAVKYSSPLVDNSLS